MNTPSSLWNRDEGRPRAPVRLVVGFLVVALLAVVGTVLAGLLVGAVWPSGPFTYLLVGSTVGLGVGAVVGVAAVARYLDRRPLADYGFRGGRAWWRDVAVGLALATLAQAAVLGVGFAAGWSRVVDTVAAGPEGFLVALVASLVTFGVVGVSEELVVRGFVLKNVAEGLADRGPVVAVAVAVVVSSLLFGLVHGANAGASPVAVAGIAVVAVTLAAGYVRTGRLGLAVGFHTGWNVALGVLFGLPVSGMTVPARVLVVEVTGPAAWTGGAFGPEAGLVGVVAGLAGLVGVVAYVRLVEGRLRVHPAVLAPTLRRDVYGAPTSGAGGVPSRRPDSDHDLTEVGAAREGVEPRS